MRNVCGLLRRPVGQFCGHVARFVTLCILFQEVREEEHLEYGENDEQLDKDDGPQCASKRHMLETFVVEVVDPVGKTVFSH